MNDFFKNLKEKNAINKERNALIREFGLIMTHVGAYNLKGDTFEIADEEYTNYGWRFKLFCSRGLTFEKLDTLTPYIKDGLKCAYFMYEVNSSNDYAVCDVIYNQRLTINKQPFEPYPVKPYELYFGNSVSGKPIVVDISESPFTFIAGETGTGKNGALNHALISLINSCSSDEVKILYFQGDKGDGGFYENCKQVYAYSECELDKLNNMLDYILKEEKKRKKLFENMIKTFKGDNLYKYNKIHPKNKLPYIYLVVDEFLSCTIKASDNKSTKELKNEINDKLEKMAQRTRSFGLVYIISHQKPEKALCPPFLKNMSNNRICFGYGDIICSEIVLGSGDTGAVGLPNRRAIFKSRGRRELLFTTDLTGKIEQYLSPHIVNNRPDLFEDLKKKDDKITKSNEIIADLMKNSTKTVEKEEKEVVIDANGLKVTEKKRNYATYESSLHKGRSKESVAEAKREEKKKKSNDEKPIEKPSSNFKKKTKEELIIEAIKNNPNFVPYNEKEAKIMNMIKLNKEDK